MDFIEITNKSGATIIARPLKLDFDELTIIRRDDKVFILSLNDLDEASRKQVIDYLGEGFPKADKQDANLPLPPGQITPALTETKREIPFARKVAVDPSPKLKLSNDRRKLWEAVYQDRGNDVMAAVVPALNIREVAIARGGNEGLSIEVSLVELAGSPLNQSNFQMLLLFDLDNDAATGMADPERLGIDANAIIHFQPGGQCSFATEIFSKTGESNPLKVEVLQVGSANLRFVVESKAFADDKAFRIALLLGPNAETTVDRFPDEGTLPFSFNYERYRDATDGW